MKVLVDTSVWSLAFRKKGKSDKENSIIELLSELIRDTRIIIVGPIRQEILSGISDRQKFEELKEKLSIFKDSEICTEDYEFAARYYNECRSKGIQGSHIDFLICAVAIRNNYLILTLGNDFEHFKDCIQLKTMKIENV